MSDLKISFESVSIENTPRKETNNYIGVCIVKGNKNGDDDQWLEIHGKDDHNNPLCLYSEEDIDKLSEFLKELLNKI